MAKISFRFRKWLFLQHQTIIVMINARGAEVEGAGVPVGVVGEANFTISSIITTEVILSSSAVAANIRINPNNLGNISLIRVIIVTRAITVIKAIKANKASGHHRSHLNKRRSFSV